MLLTAAFFVLFEICVVASYPMKSSNEYSIQESKADVEWQDDFLIREDRARKRECNRSETYVEPEETDWPLNYPYCRICECNDGYQSCWEVTCNDLRQCDKEDRKFSQGNCCPECQTRTSCSEDRKVGERWQRLKKPGVCSLCECMVDGKELCEDNNLTCLDIPGCLEAEMKLDYCCPQCKTWAKPTTQPSFTIQLLTEGSEPSFTFPNWRDTAEDQVEN